MSAVWVFQQFAAAIGRDRELAHLRAFHYGSATFEHGVNDFWLNGDLTITPVEQIAFLKRMFTYDLPVNYLSVYPAKVNAVSSAQAAAIANKYFRAENMFLIAVGDKAKIQPGIEKLNLGPVEEWTTSAEPVKR